ncbi:MAG: PSD1 domain-containing protein, partial [Opitutaceae bacterium]|nr:PSD1 domain-containing protein [Verrucomicrobiales bacterium]
MSYLSITAIRAIVMAGLATLTFTSSVGAAESLEQPIEFNRDIRPILSENCFLCHGPDKSHRKGKLRLDDRSVAVEKEAIVPGKPEKSELIARINNPDPDDVMPPLDTHKTLTPHQKELLTRWIAQGAEYQPHWSYLTPKKTHVPKVRNVNFKIQNPIDAFILSALDAKTIQPSPPADKAMLLRRVSLDLTGLPPTPDEVRAFLNDRSSRAYERAVDRLLASPRYGERMAVAWLDVARFADTVGYHGDQNQNIFPYRDYVINAFNRNKPFDQFTVEQLAGDLLPKPTTEQRVATGFNRLNMVTREGGAQPKEYLAKYAADRVRTVSTTWLGSTMGCAECHDHKFDPFSARDFYQMEAFFADIKQWGVYSDYTYTPNPDLKDWSNDHPFPPEITVESPYLQNRLARLLAKIDEVRARAGLRLESDELQRVVFDSWMESSRAFLARNPDGWSQPAAFVPTADDKAVVNADGSVLFKGAGKKDDEHQIRFALPEGHVAALRLELLPDPSHKGSIVRGGGKAATVQFTPAVERADGKDAKSGFYQADSATKQLRYANGAEIFGIKDGWKIDPKQTTNTQTGIYLFDTPIKSNAGDELVLTFKAPAIGRIRVSLSPFAVGDPLDGKFRPDLASALGKSGLIRSGRNLRFIRDSYLLSTGWDAGAFTEFKKLQIEVLECRNGQAPTLVTEAWKPATTRVLARGNWQDETGDIVDPAPPHFLPQPKVKGDRRLTRLDLAKWLVSPDNPLTARTFVNRTWKQFFGNGLSAVVDDLGAQGEWPTHPELLDWLSVEFRESGWDVKRLVRLFVLSSTYRQDS